MTMNLKRSPPSDFEMSPVQRKYPRTDEQIQSIKSQVLKNLRCTLCAMKSSHDVLLKEVFFLENNGNFMDFSTWQKKSNVLRENYLKQHDLELGAAHLKEAHSYSDSAQSSSPEIVASERITTSVQKLHGLPSSTTIQIPLSTVSPTLHVTPPKGSNPLSPARSIALLSSSPRPATRAHASFSSVYENSHEDIVMRARHEAEVMRAISELRKEGLWCASRLPKVQEPTRIKTHWDYLMEEMQWLAADFGNEKRWKINAARKLSRSVAHYHKENCMQQAKTEKEEHLKLRKIASAIAKEVKFFWDSMRKIVEHKHQLILEAKRKKAMDLHLEFIVDQTAKYSDWLAQGLGNTTGSSEPSIGSTPSVNDSDGFLSPPEESDDENTIELEEQAQVEEGGVNYENELNQLLREGEMPLEDLLASLPEDSVQESELSSDEESDVSSEVEEGGLENLEEACKTEAGLSDVAAAAEKFQPKGFTLDTTEVKTTIPFLLKHKLREYQHIGLDWLVAMHERKLNGILADEMGLGKTIQTIALLAHLVCEKRIWGPHLIIVPTSVLLNWEYELKKWCPALKILTYFGSLKERKQKRIGWSKRNAFHICITSYNIAVTDHRAFKQQRWNYLILDEAQNIKNFRSQRWQTLLNFSSQHRLLLTGTPLQNHLMELWSLMHFLMPMVFSSHSDFKEWFSNPLSGMVEGSQEYNDSIVRRLHQVLRPFLLRRLKVEVEKQMPQKYEHIVPCHLSKRQRFLYDEYMSRAKTKDNLASGNYLSVINILMQLRKVCNHPDLFEPRPIISPFQMEAMDFCVPSHVLRVLEYDPFKHVNLNGLNLKLCDYELAMDAFSSFRTRQLQTNRTSFLDLSSFKDNRSEFDDTDGYSDGSPAQSFLEDLHVPEMDKKMQQCVLSRCKNMYEVSSRRCRKSPIYGRDLIGAVRKLTKYHPLQHNNYQSNGDGTSHSAVIHDLIPTLKQRLENLNEIIKRFLIYVPTCVSRPVGIHAYHPHPSQLQDNKSFDMRLENELLSCTELLHPLATGTCFHFPERRLIQYDCGKLQTMDSLLQKLKADDHRVLIFTQMSRMLDILEIFLNYHGLTYLRLDGATPVQKRQYLMDQFNRDQRIFCFILSTRSGGLGVNLTGADTVIFYDSDWNPTMDAQAQDRCHRIGQTRDVHIYRLICASTVEENILKKANQKRMLGNIAIEGGAFTTEFFKQTSLRELFDPAMEERVCTPNQEATSSISQKEVEELLFQAEEDGDAKAASQAKAEQVAEYAEFDENYTGQDKDTKVKYEDEETAKAMSEFASVEEQLNSIEKYAMSFLEEETAEFAAEQLRHAEENILLAKKDWELGHLQSLREEEEEKIAEEEVVDNVPLTYDRPDLSNKTYKDENSGEEMPMWLPPTPPSDDSQESHIDAFLEMKYDTQSVISPAVLAAIAPFSEEDYDVFGLRRQSTDSAPIKKTSKSKQMKEHVNVPPSLFWRRFAADTLSTKLKRLASHQKKIKTKDQFTPLLEQQPEGPEWTIDEDWILLKSINGVLEFPISLTISVPAQIPNWSIIADITSSVGRVRRSPLQCREHLMNVVIPREDGSAKGDEHTHEAKRHKSKDTLKKSKSRREQRTKSLVVNNSKEHTKQFSCCFDRMIQASVSRKHTPKFTWDTVQKPSMHSDLLKDYGIHIESVQSPMQIAQQRADRIQAEHPRHNPVQQVLSTQPYHGLSSAPRSYPGTQFPKPAVTVDLPKVGFNVSRPGAASVTVPQRLSNSNSSTTTFSPAKNATNSVPTSSQHTTSISSSAPTTVVKTYTTTSTGVGELNKTLSITRGLTTQQQLLLLRQTTLQQQQAISTAPSTLSVQPLVGTQTQVAAVQQKLSLPPGIEQLRATVASAASVLPRFAGIATTSGSAVRGLTSGRTLQTEEVLALLKQQSMRMQSAQLTTKPQVSSYQAALKSVTSSSTAASQQNMSTTVAQNFKAQIQALAAQQKSPAIQTKLPEKK